MATSPAAPQDHKHAFQVEMTCEGCARVVRAVLTKVPGVQEVNIDVSSKQVVVTGTASVGDMLAAIKKTGKTAVLG